MSRLQRLGAEGGGDDLPHVGGVVWFALVVVRGSCLILRFTARGVRYELDEEEKLSDGGAGCC